MYAETVRPFDFGMVAVATGEHGRKIRNRSGFESPTFHWSLVTLITT